MKGSAEKSTRRSKPSLVFVWNLGEKLCQKNFVLAFLFTWLLVFLLYSSSYDSSSPPSKLSNLPARLESMESDGIRSNDHKKLDSFHDSVNLISDEINYLPLKLKTTISPEEIRENSNVMMIKKMFSKKIQCETSSQKSILFFTNYFSMPDFQFGFGQQAFIDNNCSETNCFTTNDKNLMAFEKFDAIVFHIRDMDNGRIPIPNQKRRLPNQRYVMFLMESPLNDDFPYERFGNFFNWTMTYRLDSDFVRPYSWVEPKDEMSGQPPSISKLYSMNFPQGSGEFLKSKTKEIETSGKSKMAAWLVSNCNTHSEREYFVEELQRFIAVDIYGSCGSMSCSRDDENECLSMLEKTYKFYLSFENSFCDDYITEKFFKILNYDMIPIVMGGGDYTKIAPAKSYINAKDFKSIGDLSEYLKYLDRNATAYAEYFEWKKFFKVKTDFVTSMCNLCKALNNPSEPPKTYDNIFKWWRSDAHCLKKGRFPWSKTVLETYVDFFKKGASAIFDIVSS